MKVHRALTDLQKDYTNQFATMGIPFFNTSSKLIVEEAETMDVDARNDVQAKTSREIREGNSITRAELVALQKRMIGLLEDLCGD